MVGLNSVGPCWCWKLGKCCRTLLVEATRPQVLSLSFFFPPLAIPPLDFHSKAKLVALSQSIWMPPSMGVCKVHQFHPPKQFKLYFATPAQLLQHRAVSLCRAPTSAKIAWAASGFLHKHLQNAPGILQNQVWVSSSWGNWHQRVVPMVTGLVWNLLHPNAVRSP